MKLMAGGPAGGGFFAELAAANAKKQNSKDNLNDDIIFD